MDDFHHTEGMNLEEISANVGKCLDQITAMRVECADMQLALAALDNPMHLKKLTDLAFEHYGENTGEDNVTLIDNVKEEAEETRSVSGDEEVRAEEMDAMDVHSRNDDDTCDSLSEVVVNNESTKN